tara:strand:- start:478 stop:1137 length:660 start_codon:yes stop_codon:yes gene_type:complete
MNYSSCTTEGIDDAFEREFQTNDLNVNFNTNSDYMDGLSFGIENIDSKGSITGLTWTRRGFDLESNASVNLGSLYYEYNNNISAQIDLTIKQKADYITGYFLFPLSRSNRIQFYGGMEVGYLLEVKMTGVSSVTLGYNGQNEISSYPMTLKADTDDWEDMGGNIFDYGLLLAAEYEMNSKVSLKLSYYHGLVEDIEPDVEYAHRGIKLSISMASSNLTY